MHEHPVDYVITLAAPALLAVIVVHPHSVTLFQWIAWLLVANIGQTKKALDGRIKRTHLHWRFFVHSVLPRQRNLSFLVFFKRMHLVAPQHLVTRSLSAVNVLLLCLWLLLGRVLADDHCGYAFPWSPVRWFPLSANTDQHEFHHSKNMGCFASKLAIYDQLFDR